jgi:type II secretory pathway pseudopilin PulG
MAVHRHRRRRPAAAPAFSLVELVLCGVIVALLAAVALPRYASALTRFELDAAARRVAADVDLARSAAAAGSRSVEIQFLTDTDQIHIVNLPGLDGPDTEYRSNLAAEPYRTDLATADLGGDNTLTFDGYGRPDSGGSVTLVRGAAHRTVTVDPDTGKAVVQ